ncbi:zinc finger protein 182-like [Actinia tenebrosa]|uniref:Zinc finger protein 182-like n=1 Tax=Actinia tenebrosa TaxID=6105 RepID=A0A6P8GZT9_ACTTE|nr:zinc finger protein 182-like [Actinia tenebrosa]
MMARTKQTPVKSAQNESPIRKSGREKRKASTRGMAESKQSKKRKLRFSSQNDEKRSSTIKKPKAKGKPNDYLPPELRKAGLLAQQSVAKGKCFGPFRGHFSKAGKKTDNDCSLVCKIKGVDEVSYFFFVHDTDKEKCMWLQGMQSASSKMTQNMVAYKSAVGVCYEATCDINPGEELLVLYDDTYGGKKYPAYVESIPVQFVPQSGEGQLTVLPLNEQEVENADETQEDIAGIGTNNDDADDGTRDDDDDDNSDDDEEDFDNDVTDKDFSLEDDQAKMPTPKKKPKEVTKVTPSVNEIISMSLMDGTETTHKKYQCAYCAEEFSSHDAAVEHVTSQKCTSLLFTCDSGCGRTFDSNLSKITHKCNGKSICSVCDMEMSSYRELSRHMKEKRDDEDHKPRCTKCDIIFATRKKKYAHMRNEHASPDSMMACPVCHKLYTKSYLKEHLQSHAPDAFKCTLCQKQFSSKSNLRKHIHKHSPGYTPVKDNRRYEPRKRKHECSECQKMFDSPHSLEIHMRSHTGERPYQCELCHWKFSQKPHLKRHMKTVHCSDDEEKSERSLPPAEKPKTCELCNKVYSNSRVLRVHIQSVHEKERPHKCSYCEATFTQRGHLWRHKHTTHPECDEVQKKLQVRRYVCTVKECEASFCCQAELTSHLSTVHQMKWPFHCDECSATFANRSNLNKHRRRRHKCTPDGVEKPFICDTCENEFESHYKLTQHIRTHTGEKEFKCELCGQGFVQKSGLNKHIRCRRCPKIEGSPVRQISSKKYQCEICERVFPGPSDLKSHARTHTGEKPFECPECHKRFSQTGNLTKHIKYVHNKVKRPKDKPRQKNFFCSLCGKAFACPSSLAMHCRTHSGTKPFKCDTCQTAFSQLGNLKKHLKRWHDPVSGTVPKRKRVSKKKAKGQKDEATVENEVGELSEARNENEAMMSKEASQPNESNENSVNHESEVEEGDNNSNSQNDAEVMRREETAIASILTSITSDQSFANNRGFTPLNTPTPGFYISPLNSAISNIGPSFTRASIIMTSMSPVNSTVTVPAVMSQMQQNMEPHTQLAPVFVPSPIGSFMTVVPPTAMPQITTSSALAPITSVTTSSISSSSTILPHMHTILTSQIDPQHYVPHTTMNQVQTTDIPMYPFSPSSLFQH